MSPKESFQGLEIFVAAVALLLPQLACNLVMNLLVSPVDSRGRYGVKTRSEAHPASWHGYKWKPLEGMELKVGQQVFKVGHLCPSSKAGGFTGMGPRLRDHKGTPGVTIFGGLSRHTIN